MEIIYLNKTLHILIELIFVKSYRDTIIIIIIIKIIIIATHNIIVNIATNIINTIIIIILKCITLVHIVYYLLFIQDSGLNKK